MANGLEIAIIGMAGRFPAAPDLTTFWQNLVAGSESISHFTEDELAAAGVSAEELADPAYVRAQGVMPDAELFDAEFFGISPKEADIMDPQQRALLECAWQAMEDAGYDPARVPGPVGVFAGTYYNSYLPELPPVDDPAEVFARNVANEKDYVASRIAYKLDLTGPAVTVQTACSTSLVAVHLAGQALLSGACDLALAGGATVRARQVAGYRYQPGGIFSADGHCRAFDAAADGTVPGNGAGMVVLKRLADAQADGDTVHAVILGSAIGNDGADRVGFTAPGVAGQARVIAAAYAMAEVSPASVGYVEAHGSATRLGDPIEVEALRQVFRGAPAGSCAIGSVKTNVGHTHAAAGIAGLIKAVLTLRHGMIPPSRYFAVPNPDIDLAATPFFVNREPSRWRGTQSPRRAAVSSFGMGGTGAHVVLEQVPARSPAPSAGPAIAPISARSPAALEELTDRLAEHLAGHAEVAFADTATTLQVGRRAFAHRRVVLAEDPAEAGRALAARDPGLVYTATVGADAPSVAFLFPGLGDQRPGMGDRLYATRPPFRRAVDECAELLEPLLGLDIRRLLYPGDGTPAATGGPDLRRMLGRRTAPEVSEVDQTRYAHPAVFVTEYALAQLWLAYGVRPTALIGYSLGEYVAACLSGVLSLPDALRLIVLRAQLLADLPAGAMLAVPLAEADLAPYLGPEVSLAAVNGPALCVLAGAVPAVTTVRERLAADGIAAQPVRTSHAFHSVMMDPAVAPFVDLVASIPRAAPRIPYVSNVTGTWVTARQVRDPRFWGRHLRQPVRFADGVAVLWQEPGRVLLEVGPGRSLGSLALALLPPGDSGPAARALASLPGAFDGEDQERFLLANAAKLWLAGVELDWCALGGGGVPHRVPLPTYAFQRRRHWLVGAGGRRPSRGAAPLARKTDVADWFQVPAWAPLPPRPRTAQRPPDAHGPWLVFLDRHGVGQAVADRLARAGHAVTTVHAEPGTGSQVRPAGGGGYAMCPRDGDYGELLRVLRETGRYPQHIAHLWAVGDGGDPLGRGFFSLLGLARALGGQPAGQPVRLTAVTSDVHRVAALEPAPAERAMAAAVLGPIRVLPLEHPHVDCRAIDITLADRVDPTALLAEMLDPVGVPLVVLRDRRRWHQVFQPVRLDPAPPPATGRTYLITGGLGGVGLAVARRLARTERAGLVLAGRTALPPREEWAAWLAVHPAHDPTSIRIRAVREIEEAAGRSVLLLTADVGDADQIRATMARAVEQVGPIHVVVHAAGVAGGGLIQLKEADAAGEVLAPKAAGALHLAAAAREHGVAVLVLCSSTLALTGAVGQVDYVAANAVLDALAQGSGATTGPEIVSVNWDAWQDVGMAQRHLGGGERPVDHPLLERRLDVADGYAVYAATFDSGSWLVDEHRMLGAAVVPGTGHLELARAAFSDLCGEGPVELSDVRFYTPAVVGEQPRELRVVINRAAQPHQFTVISRYPGDLGPEPRWQVHATGQVARMAATQPAVHDVAGLAGGGQLRDLGVPGRSGPMGYGPRSRCLRRIWQGEREALAELELPAPFIGDLERLGLHPSLLDLAAGFVGVYLAEDFRIPISYGRLRYLRPLSRRLYSHHRYHEADRAGRETTTADISLLDEAGRELVRIEDFVLKRVPALGETLGQARDGTGTEVAFFQYPRPANAPAGTRPLAAHLATGIGPDEGADALTRILAAGLGPQVAVATKHLAAIAADIASSRLDPDSGVTVDAPTTHPRPNLLTPYRAASDELEEMLVDVWRELLGVGQVGVDDVFVELGGHSLLGLAMVNRLHDKLGVQVPLGVLFEARTVAQLAQVLRPMTATGERGGHD